MIVALRALDGRAEPHRAECVHAIEDLVHAVLLGVGAGLDVAGRAAVEASRDALLFGCARKQVACELLDGELIERHVRIQRADDPIAIRPKFAQVIALKTMRVRIARDIEPRSRPLLPILRRGEETIRERLDCGLRIAKCGLGKGVHLLGRRRQSDEIEIKPSRDYMRLGIGRRLHPLPFQPRANERINGILNFELRLLFVRHRRCHVSPMLRQLHSVRPRRTRRDPRADGFDLCLGQRLAAAGHHFVVALRQRDAPHQFARVRLSAHDGRAVFTALERRLAHIQPQPALFLFRTVALEARALEHRINVPLKVHRRRSERCRGW